MNQRFPKTHLRLHRVSSSFREFALNQSPPAAPAELVFYTRVARSRSESSSLVYCVSYEPPSCSSTLLILILILLLSTVVALRGFLGSISTALFSDHVLHVCKGFQTLYVFTTDLRMHAFDIRCHCTGTATPPKDEIETDRHNKSCQVGNTKLVLPAMLLRLLVCATDPFSPHQRPFVGALLMTAGLNEHSFISSASCLRFIS